MTKRQGLAIAGLLAGAAFAAPASAATYLFTFAGTGLSGSGTFVTSNTANANGSFTITGSTGTATIGATTISLSGPTTFAGADNVLFYPTTPYLSFDGTSFLGSNGNSYNIYYSAGSSAYRVFDSNSNFTTLTSFTVRPAVSAVPEPSSWALMIGGIGMIGGTLRARARRKAFAAA